MSAAAAPQSAIAEVDPASAVGAKRRKPTKTNKVPQIQPIAMVHAPDMEEDDDDDDEATSHGSPPPTMEPEKDELSELVQPKSESLSIKLPNPLPPGMPVPPISSTSVVEPSATDQMYTCPLCHENQATQKDFTTHIRGHNEVKPHNDPNDPTGQSKVYYCCLCGKMLSSFSSLDRHMLVHSGERPFSCDLCGQTFTTNGNMHRHKRTHGNRESHANNGGLNEGATPASAASRGRVGRKRKNPSAAAALNGSFGEEPMSPGHLSKLSKAGEAINESGAFKCPVCPQTFSSELNLDHHIFEAHPGQEVACEQCGFTCPNYNYLKLHKTMFHFASSASYTSPSSKSSTSLAAPAKPASNGKPQSAFAAQSPPSSSGASPPPIMVIPMSQGPLQLPPQVICAAAEAAAKNSNGVEDNDLSDVQSMLSMAAKSNGRSLMVDHATDSIDESSSAADQVEESKSVSGHEGVCLVEDPIIRDMKLKGEFPCRLCPAVYPNLRALKGHNKEHLGKPPYVCNVGACTYNSNDKSTLTRHMRTHTGEKPFECKLCSYGFTTKANCERHLKNKHGKTSREAIRTSIIVHESEDPDAISAARHQQQQQEEDNENDDDAIAAPRQFRCKVCKQIFSSSAKVIAHAVKDHPAYSNDVDHIFEEVKKQQQHPSIARMLLDQGSPSMVPRPVALIDQLTQKKQQEAAAASTEDTEAPLDLSSRPPSSETGINKKPSLPLYSNLPPLRMHGKFPMMAPADLLASNAQVAALMASSGMFPYMPATLNQGGGGVPTTSAPVRPTNAAGFPLLFPFLQGTTNFMHLMPGLESLPGELREQMKQRLAQLSAGVQPPPPVIPGGGGGASGGDLFMQQQDYLRKQTAELKEQKEAAEALQHLSKVQNLGKAPPPPAQHHSTSSNNEKAELSTDRGNNSDSDSNYKMVIKNGVLMKKQKQRRYRTERPYGCNFCEARFTLRSNMERHIKQQHPQHWCQKPRGSRRNHAATVPVLAPQFRASTTTCQDLVNDESSASQEKPDDPAKAHHSDGDPLEEEEDEEEEEEEGFEVSEDNGEDGSLIIDEPCTSSPGVSQDTQDLASVSKLLNTASSQSFIKYFDHEDDEEGSSGSNHTSSSPVERKKSAYSAAPHKIACPYCERKFPWTSSLNRHILTHTGHKPFKCPECNLWFTTKSNCDRHLVRKHGGNNNNGDQLASYTMRNVPDRPYKCKMCPSSTFSSQSNLRKHHLSKHGEFNEENEEGDDEFSMEEEALEEEDGMTPFRCHICSIGFEVRALALTHMRTCHAEECATIEANISSLLEMPGNAQEASANADKGVECIFCPAVLSSFLELRKHVSRDHGVKYTCDICQKSFSLKKLLVRHKKKHDSGVSSGDDYSDADDAAKQARSSVQASNCITKETSVLTVAQKKKPSLMDTINKLSSKQKKDSSSKSTGILDNLFISTVNNDDVAN